MQQQLEEEGQALTCGSEMAESTGGLGTLTSRYSCPMMVLDW